MENIRIRTATVDEVPAPFISFPDLNLDLQATKHPKPYGFGCFSITYSVLLPVVPHVLHVFVQ